MKSEERFKKFGMRLEGLEQGWQKVSGKDSNKERRHQRDDFLFSRAAAERDSVRSTISGSNGLRQIICKRWTNVYP